MKIEDEVLLDADKTERDLFRCAVSQDLSSMVHAQVKESVHAEISRQLEAHKDELREKVATLVASAITNMKISIPSLTVSLTAYETEGDYE